MNKWGHWITIAAMLLVWAGPAVALTPDQKCQQKKLKAQGKLELCLKKNAAKMLAGHPDASATCQSKFTDKLTEAGTCRYLDNGDGTVSDLDTGLVWEKKDDASGIHDKDDTYTWSATGTLPDGTAFTTFLGTLNNGTSADGTAIGGCFAGQCDWRLPTSAELQTILLAPFLCGTSPCIDPVFGPRRSNFYWSATTLPFDAWGVSFYDGYVSFDKKTFSYYVRAVRGGL